MKRFRTPDGKYFTASFETNSAIRVSAEAEKTSTSLAGKYSAKSLGLSGTSACLDSPHGRRRYWIHVEKDRYVLSWPGGCTELIEEEISSAGAGVAKELQPLRLTMPGKVVDVKVKPGDLVEKGQCLLVVEAMKMENNLLALGNAKVEKVLVKKEDRLDSGAILVTFIAR
jgi:acetyl/propionyl-CoA carboxylase alpha subunit